MNIFEWIKKYWKWLKQIKIKQFVNLSRTEFLKQSKVYAFFKKYYRWFRRFGWKGLTQTKKGRFISLIILSIVGMFLTTLFSDCIIELLSFDGDERQESYAASSIRVLLLGLPVFIGLWYFRTHDTREQIEKTQEQIEKSQEQIEISHKQTTQSKEQIEKSQENTYTSILSNGLNLISTNNVNARRLGLVTLAVLKQTVESSVIQTQLDQSTTALSLNGFSDNKERLRLMYVDLSGMNFPNSISHFVDFSYSDLRYSNFENATFIEVDFKESKLQGANLQGACFCPADMNHQVAKALGLDVNSMLSSDLNSKLDTALLDGAFYDTETKFPPGFEPEDHGMIEVDENGYPINKK